MVRNAETVREEGPGTRPPGGTTVVGAHTRPGLPPDLLSSAARRLAIASSTFLVVYTIAYLAFWISAPRSLMPAGGHPVGHVGAGLAVVSSIAMLLLVRARRSSPHQLIDLGLIYEVIGAFAISLAELALPWNPGEIPRGISYVVMWILIFPLLVPTTPGKALLSAVVAASMGPLALLVMVAYGNRMPDAPQVLLLVLPNYLAAGAALIAARTIYQLGTAVEEARTMGNYQLVERLGTGGMGEVWRAEHRMLIRPAAIKLVRPEILDPSATSDPKTVLKRFEREAQATALLSSPHTVELYDFGVTADGTLFYAMELLDGLDLDALIGQTGPVAAERAVHILIQVCDSLADAHERGLIHRDIKPANIYVCRRGVQHDFVKVLDFGLVRSVRSRGETKLTSEGSMTGTPAFMAPEQAMGDREPDVAADLYALGGVAYWLLAGRFVFDADTPMKMILHHVQTAPAPPSQVVELPIPPSLDALVLDLLQKQPEQRPPSAGAVAERLEQIRAELPRWDQTAAQKWWTAHRPQPPRTTLPTKPRRVDRV